MSLHTARVDWARTTPDFAYDTYSRAHTVTFGGGVSVVGSAAPEFRGDASRVNPEEALVGALSACHMLTFLAIAARKGILVDRYEDAAEGVLEKKDGRLCVTRVVLRPKVTFAGDPPAPEALARLHEQAHNGCFIANSVKTEVTVEPG